MTKDLTKGTPWKVIALFSVPVLIGNIFSAAVQSGRYRYCGKYPGLSRPGRGRLYRSLELSGSGVL